jgi:hypothetical protein
VDLISQNSLAFAVSFAGSATIEVEEEDLEVQRQANNRSAAGNLVSYKTLQRSKTAVNYTSDLRHFPPYRYYFQLLVGDIRRKKCAPAPLSGASETVKPCDSSLVIRRSLVMVTMAATAGMASAGMPAAKTMAPTAETVTTTAKVMTAAAETVASAAEAR